ncbi:rhamnulokinase [Lachnospiraceae bacterium ASD3451]|nr:rhamnulokinase family protein [Diplocloster agilis]MBU9742967.1 rhamnulokinase [Diplocloster agilis]
MKNKGVLAFDIGASSGRAVLGLFDQGSIRLKEIHRFQNTPVEVRGVLYWDILSLFHEIKNGIRMAQSEGTIVSLGIDTWGLDFGLLDKQGRLLENPIHYRDSRTGGMKEAGDGLLGNSVSLYKTTGIQFLENNTVYQLLSLVLERPDFLDNAETLLMIPDLLEYMLTNNIHAEYSAAMTTQLVNTHTGMWSERILDKLGIPARLFPPIIPSGSIAGKLSPMVQKELGVDEITVMAVASHDSQSAVLAVPAGEKEFIFISCGTWSFIGTELDAPVISRKAELYNMTNERGYKEKVTFATNITGLWVLQECRRQWEKEGSCFSYEQLEEMGTKAVSAGCFIDTDHECFTGVGDMPENVREYCARTNQSVPGTPGEFIRCIYESLAMKYRLAIERISECTGNHYSCIYVVGGGSKSGLLCQLTADICKTRVISGPAEATAMGNVLLQLMASKEIKDIEEGRAIIRNTQDVRIFEPDTLKDWELEYKKFIQTMPA